jgi:predicted dehydrogenase
MGDVSVSATLLWPDGGVASISDHLTNRPQQSRSDVSLEGTGGAIFGRIGIWDKYPYPSPDEVSFQGAGSSSATLLSNTECWIPDAFAGPISEIAEAVVNKRPPTVSAIDAVKTMKLIEAIYESSANEGRLVALPM